MVSSVVYLTASIGHLYDVIYQNNASSLHDFNPRFSSGFHSLIARDSRNDSFSQLSDLLITSVFSRTQFIFYLEVYLVDLQPFCLEHSDDVFPGFAMVEVLPNVAIRL